jgi:iron complex outermembrane receptor protein
VVARAQELREDPPDLTGLSLEELANVDIVYAAAKHEQSGREAASSVTIVTAAEIRQFGYRTLADVLRGLAGFHVTDDRNYSYVGVRGFGRPGDYSTRVLLLVDGQRSNDAIYDQAAVGLDFPVDVDLIDRIEVVRGPGASIHGNSAFFAVVNVITRRGRDVGGFELSAGAGGFGTSSGRATWGRRFASGSEALLSAGVLDRQGERLYFPEFDAPETGDGIVQGADGERTLQLFGSLSRGAWALEAAHVSRDKGIPTGSYGTAFGDTRSRTSDDRTLVQLRHSHKLGAKLSSDLRLHYGRYDYLGTYAQEDAPLYTDTASGRWWGVDWNAHAEAGSRHSLTFGGEFLHNPRQDQWGAYGDEADLEVRESSSRWALYAQDELRLSDSLTLHAGLRHDRYESFGSKVSPRAGLVWLPDKATSLKLLYGEAFRASNEYELHYWDAQEGVALRPETIRTYELVGERLLGSNLRVSASLFSNGIEELITFRSDPAYHFENVGAIDSRGFETGVEGRLGRRAEARLSYSYQETTDRDSGLELTNSARHMLKARLRVTLPQGASLGLEALHLSSRLTLGRTRSAPFTATNAVLLAPRLFGHLDASLAAYNLFDARYGDPGSEEHVQSTIPQPRRNLVLKLTARF